MIDNYPYLYIRVCIVIIMLAIDFIIVYCTYSIAKNGFKLSWNKSPIRG